MKIKGKYDAIVNPAKRKHSPDLGSVTVMVSIESDLKKLCRSLGVLEKDYKSIMMSRLYTGDGIEFDFSIIGPVVGASYATILLENLIVWGAKEIIFVGYCGAVSCNVNIGDIILVKGSMIDEGVSRHYDVTGSEVITDQYVSNKNAFCISYPSARLSDTLKKAFIHHRVPCKEGIIWTTDAVFRETREKVAYYQTKDVLAVEMETSALFSVAAFRGAGIAAVLVVSDEISDYTWRTGFKDKKFIKSCKDVCKVASSYAKKYKSGCY